MRLSLTATLAAAFLCGAALPAVAATPGAPADKCFVMAEKDEVVVTTAFDLDMAALPEGAPLPALPEGTSAVLCHRSQFVLGPNDWRIPAELGKPFMLSGGGRLGALEISGGQIRFRLVKGELGPEENAEVVKWLNEFQAHGARY